MRALMLVLLLVAHLGRAADDAPLICSGTCVPDAQRIAEAKLYVSTAAERDALKASLEKSTPLHPLVVAGIVVLGVVLGGAAGAGIYAAAAKK